MQRRRNGACDGHGTIAAMPAAPGVKSMRVRFGLNRGYSGDMNGIRGTDDTGWGKSAIDADRDVSATGEPLKNNILAVLVAGLYEHDITNRRSPAPSEGV